MLSLVALSPSAWAGEAAQREAAAAWRADSARAVREGDLGATDELARAVAEHPRVQAALARWEQSVAEIAGARALPNPQLMVQAFLLPVETRVGPQQAKLSLRQPLPWPGALVTGRDAAIAGAAVEADALEAVVVSVAAEARRAHWALWTLRQTTATHHRHLGVLDALAATLRARVETGQASVADLQQLELSRARLEEDLLSWEAREVEAEAALAQALGRRPGEALRTPAPPPPAGVPAASGAALEALALAHPDVALAAGRVRAAEAETRRRRALRAPDLSVGVDWILTGPAAMPGIEGSGRDALGISVGLELPLWQGTDTRAIQAAQAQGLAASADLVAAEQAAASGVAQAASRVRDGARRVERLEVRLLPLAQSAYDALLGAYTAGEAGVAQLLLAERDLLALEVERETARGALEIAWTELEARCGETLARRPLGEVSDG